MYHMIWMHAALSNVKQGKQNGSSMKVNKE